MSLFSAVLDPLTGTIGRRPSGARLYHRGSVFAEPVRCRMDRAHAWRLMAHAEALERETRCPGKHGGILKRTGLEVLRALLRAFYSYRDGTCFPSYAAIAEAAGCCIETVRMAIRRLEAAGIVSTIRRKVVASFVSRVHRVRFDCAVQTSNSYTFAMPAGGNQAASIEASSQGARTDLAEISATSPPPEPDASKWHETSEPIKRREADDLATALEGLRRCIEDRDGEG